MNWTIGQNLNSDIQGLHTLLLSQGQHRVLQDPARKTVTLCWAELVPIACQYKIKIMQDREDENKVTCKALQAEFKDIINAAIKLIEAIQKLRPESKYMIQNMADEFDNLFDAFSLREKKFINNNDKNIDSSRILETWLISRAGRWFEVDRALVGIDGEVTYYNPHEGETTPINELKHLIEWITFMNMKLINIKDERAKQGTALFYGKWDAAGWLVPHVAAIVTSVGRGKTHALSIAQAIADWADPTTEAGDQWGKTALKQWVPGGDLPPLLC